MASFDALESSRWIFEQNIEVVPILRHQNTSVCQWSIDIPVKDGIACILALLDDFAKQGKLESDEGQSRYILR